MLASGRGSLAQALIAAASEINYPAEVVAVVSDNPEAQVLTVADLASIPSKVVSLSKYHSRELWSVALTEVVKSYQPDWVISVGFAKILSADFLQQFSNRVINTHPSLLPRFPGANAVADALAAGVALTGASIHYVDEGMDTGPVIAQEEVPVLPGDDVETLHERIKETERRQLVDVVGKLMSQ